MTIAISVDDKPIEAQEGASLLAVCLANDIYIPNLCWLGTMTDPPASCRLCFVDIDGWAQPQMACRTAVRPGLMVKTDTPAVRRLQRRSFQLLMSCHEISCKACPANKKCDLQHIARFLKTGLKPKHINPHRKEAPATLGHPFLDLDINRCVLCGRCIHTCRHKHGQSFLTFIGRGIDTMVGFYNQTNASVYPLRDCRACVDICPVCAITPKPADDQKIASSPT
jgi:NADH dehydrogenase/NADH:ubiquinone oxidoreductase subunit G